MIPRWRSSRRRAQCSTARIRTTETTTRSSARCNPSAVAASARPCTTSSTASRRSALAHHATDIAVAGASQIRLRTGTRRFTRSAIVCAASRLSGTSNTRSNALCGPCGQTAGARAATTSQITQSAPPTDSRDSVSSIRALRTARTAPIEAQGEGDGGQLDQAAGQGVFDVGQQPLGGTRRAAMACQPCQRTIRMNQGSATAIATAAATRALNRPGWLRQASQARHRQGQGRARAPGGGGWPARR